MALFECKHLSVDLPNSGTQKRVVDDVSFELEAGKIYDINGPSGCGKSTLLMACALQYPRAGGDLILDGSSVQSMAPEQWRARLCLVPQKAEMVPGTVADNLRLPWRFAIRKGQTPPEDERLRQLLDAVLMDDVPLDRDATQLSGGQTARVALLRSFLTQPLVLLLDEVDAALDDESSEAVSKLTTQWAQKGTAILRIRHRDSDGLAAHTFQMNEGRML